MAWIVLDDNNFAPEVLDHNGLVMVAFWADWRGTCHMMVPVLEHVMTVFAGLVQVGRLDMDRYPHVSSQYGVHTAPTLMFFTAGEAIDQIQGVVSTRDLVDKLYALLVTVDD